VSDDRNKETDAQLIRRYQETRKEYFRQSRNLHAVNDPGNQSRSGRLINIMRDDLNAMRDEMNRRGIGP
jgi:hypothetical protein